MSESLEDIKRSRNHQRNRVKQVRKARNRIVKGLSYWKARALAAENYILTGGERTDIIPGDTVSIRSGSQKMCVVSLTKTQASLVYMEYNTGNVANAKVPLVALVKRNV